MNLKQIGVLLSVSTILGMNVVSNKVLAADPSITFGKAIASGECVIEGQLSSNDGRSLSIIFDKFSAFSGARKKCVVRVNTTIPAGFSVQDVQVLYQGSVEVNTPTSKGVTFSRSYTFNGGAFGQVFAPSKTSTFKTSDPLFQRQDELLVLSASQCGGTGTLGLNLVEQSSAGSNITVDTADLNAGDVLLRFNLAPCK